VGKDLCFAIAANEEAAMNAEQALTLCRELSSNVEQVLDKQQ
jgi:hypothetical protein